MRARRFRDEQHVGALVADSLEAADRPVKLRALARVRDGTLQLRGGDADGFGCKKNGGSVQRARDARPCSTFVAEQRIGRHFDAAELYVGQAARAVQRRDRLRLALQSGCRNQKQRQTFLGVARARRARDHDDGVGQMRFGRQRRRAAELPAVLGSSGLHRHPGRVVTAVLLAERGRRARAARRDRAQGFVAARPRCLLEQLTRKRYRREERHRRECAPRLFHQDHKLDQTEAQSPMLLVDRNAGPTEIADRLPQRVVGPCFRPHRRAVPRRPGPVGQHFTRRLPKRFLFVVESEVHGLSYR